MLSGLGSKPSLLDSSCSVVAPGHNLFLPPPCSLPPSIATVYLSLLIWVLTRNRAVMTSGELQTGLMALEALGKLCPALGVLPIALLLENRTLSSEQWNSGF